MSYDGMQTNNMAGTGNVSYVMQSGDGRGNGGGNWGHLRREQRRRRLAQHDSKGGRQPFFVRFDATFTNEHLQSDNLTDELRARGLAATNKVLTLYDIDVPSAVRSSGTGCGSSRRRGCRQQEQVPASTSTRPRARRSTPRTWIGRRTARSG